MNAGDNCHTCYTKFVDSRRSEGVIFFQEVYIESRMRFAEPCLRKSFSVPNPEFIPPAFCTEGSSLPDKAAWANISIDWRRISTRKSRYKGDPREPHSTSGDILQHNSNRIPWALDIQALPESLLLFVPLNLNKPRQALALCHHEQSSPVRQARASIVRKSQALRLPCQSSV